MEAADATALCAPASSTAPADCCEKMGGVPAVRGVRRERQTRGKVRTRHDTPRGGWCVDARAVGPVPAGRACGHTHTVHYDTTCHGTQTVSSWQAVQCARKEGGEGEEGEEGAQGDEGTGVVEGVSEARSGTPPKVRASLGLGFSKLGTGGLLGREGTAKVAARLASPCLMHPSCHYPVLYHARARKGTQRAWATDLGSLSVVAHHARLFTQKALLLERVEGGRRRHGSLLRRNAHGSRRRRRHFNRRLQLARNHIHALHASDLCAAHAPDAQGYQQTNRKRPKGERRGARGRQWSSDRRRVWTRV